MTILSPVIGTIFTIFYLALWYHHRARTYILYLVSAFGFYTLATGLQIFFIPDGAGRSMMMSAILYLLCIVLLLEGCLKRKNASSNYLQIAPLLTTILVGYFYYYYIEKSLSTRIYILSFGCGLLFAAAAFRIRPSREDHLVDRAIFGIFLFLSVQLVLRPLLTISPGMSDANLGTFHESPFWLAFQFTLIVSAVLMGLALLFAIVVDITSDLKRQSATDVLTGVYNRRGFDERASDMIASGKFQPIRLVICDIDHFKNINDHHGHAAGDHVLRKFAALLTAHIRKNDIVGRIGGEEFAVLLTECASRDATMFSERVRVLFEVSGTEGLRGNSTTTASIGIADHRPGETLQQLVSRADRLLYAAKNSGRNRVCSDEAIPIAPPWRGKLYALNNRLPSP
ncbi:GGDEF domain-containing protein [Microvirga sp. 2MCAF38]|uniref:GGDEF domain-containing protein n=1 Tax=Microvirga sp. 2MCAF38 TaxID=3232989 RepID=UPI003F9AF350